MNGLPGLVVFAVVAISLSACTAKVTPMVADARTAQAHSCRELYLTLDTRVEQSGVADAQFARIAGYPYLRINRFFAADDIKPDAGSGEFEIWVEHLRGLDLDARGVELRNLPVDVRNGFGGDLDGRIEDCSRLMMSRDLNSAAARAQLLESAQVPDDYSVAKRVLGLYPFTSLPFKSGVKNLHASMQANFSRPLATLPVEGRLIRYVPSSDITVASAASVRALLEGADRDLYGIAQISSLELNRLFDAFAPVYEIDVVSDDDRIGEPFWSDDGMPTVDINRPVVFRRVSYTRFEGRTLLQLNYSVWFPSRPSSGDLDLLSGRLDGITFRVTLGLEGRPLIFDSMHNCGCYHLFVPTRRLRLKPPSGRHEEPPLVPQHVDPSNGRVVLRVAHGNHYLQRVYFDASIGEGEAYAMRNDDSLRSLPVADGGRRSLFAPDGIVVGSERGERWLFWPMGIAEPGAMRQWGRHATAFVGIRHFDDPHLIERYFVSVD